MFSRFTDAARHVVVEAQAQARGLDSPRITAGHLLLALLNEDGPIADVFRARGADEQATAREVKRAQASTRRAGEPLSEEDAAALASLGIDLEAIRARAEARFGRGALERRRRRVTPHRGLFSGRRLGGSRGFMPLPFAPGAKKALELSLREAIRLGDNHISDLHVALGVLRADDPQAVAVLSTLGVDVAEARTALESLRRRAA